VAEAVAVAVAAASAVRQLKSKATKYCFHGSAALSVYFDHNTINPQVLDIQTKIHWVHGMLTAAVMLVPFFQGHASPMQQLRLTAR